MRRVVNIMDVVKELEQKRAELQRLVQERNRAVQLLQRVDIAIAETSGVVKYLEEQKKGIETPEPKKVEEKKPNVSK